MGRAAVIIITALSAGLAFADTPTDRTRALVSALIAAEKPSKAKFAALDGFFDFDRLCGDAIKTHRSKLTDAQHAEFVSRFRSLLRLIGYPDSGTFLRKAKRTLKASGNDVVVETILEEDDVELEVTFRWATSAAGLRVYDVLFDGDSLTADYRNQFGRILAKKGADGLLKLLKERVDKETKDRGRID